MSRDGSVLIVDNAIHPLLFRPARPWKSLLGGIQITVAHLPSAAASPTLDGVAHILLTGSEASVLQVKPWFDTEVDLIRSAVDRGIPILGSCFGHEMLVYALSGPAYIRAARTPEVGWTPITMTHPDPLFDGLPNPWTTFVHHFDEVVDPPAPWRKLGCSPRCDTHVLRYGDRPVWGIQAHPEISSAKGRIFIGLTLLLGRKPVCPVLRALRTVPPVDDVARHVLHRFLSVPTGTATPRRGTRASR